MSDTNRITSLLSALPMAGSEPALVVPQVVASVILPSPAGENTGLPKVESAIMTPAQLAYFGTSPKQDLTPMAVQEITRGAYSKAYQEGGHFTFESADEFALFYLAVTGTEPSAEVLSKIDFSDAIVVAVVHGKASSGGYDIEVVSVTTDTDGNAWVKVKKTAPDFMAMVAEVITNPYHIVAFSKPAGSVNFTLERACRSRGQ